jgi:hypothetical protein
MKGVNVCHELSGQVIRSRVMACIWWRRQARHHCDATMVTSARLLLGDVENKLSCHKTSGEPRNYHSWPILTGLFVSTVFLPSVPPRWIHIPSVSSCSSLSLGRQLIDYNQWLGLTPLHPQNWSHYGSDPDTSPCRFSEGMNAIEIFFLKCSIKV